MVDKLELAIERLKKYEQEHIIRLLNKTYGAKKRQIVDRLLSIDFEELNSLYRRAKREEEIDTSALEPMRAITKDGISKEVKDSYVKTGIDIVKNNKFAVVIMAGGKRH